MPSPDATPGTSGSRRRSTGKAAGARSSSTPPRPRGLVLEGAARRPPPAGALAGSRRGRASGRLRLPHRGTMGPCPRSAPVRRRTFDDFLFRPQHSPVRSRGEVDLAMPLVAGSTSTCPCSGQHGHRRRRRDGEDARARGRHRLPAPQLLDRDRGGLGALRQDPALVRDRATADARACRDDRRGASGRAQGQRQQPADRAGAGSGTLAGILSHRDMPLDSSADARR